MMIIRGLMRGFVIEALGVMAVIWLLGGGELATGLLPSWGLSPASQPKRALDFEIPWSSASNPTVVEPSPGQTQRVQFTEDQLTRHADALMSQLTNQIRQWGDSEPIEHDNGTITSQ